jgi:hypothetical protein
MLRDRASFRLEWLALAGLLALSAPRHAAPPAPPPVVNRCPPAPLVPADPRAQADALYRAGHAGQAADLLAGDASDDLRTLAELYRAFAVYYPVAVDPSAPVTAAFEAIRRLQPLDLALGGAFADALYARMRDVAPRAAATFAARGDREAAQLARHTAETYGNSAADPVLR